MSTAVGISVTRRDQQEMVDVAPTFPDVLVQLEEWLDRHKLKSGDELKEALWVTDGVRSILSKTAVLTSLTTALGSAVGARSNG